MEVQTFVKSHFYQKMGYHIINFEATMMKLVFSESAVNFPSIGTHFCKKKVSGSRRKTMKGVNVLTEGKAKNGRLGHWEPMLRRRTFISQTTTKTTLLSDPSK